MMRVMALFLSCLFIHLLPTSSHAQPQVTDCDYEIQLLTSQYSRSSRSMYEGLIQVLCNDSSFSPYICDDSWTVADATVACRQLGFSTLGAVPRNYYYFSSSGSTQRGPALLSNIVCNGNESHLVDCQRSSVRSRTCEASMGVGVSCLPPGTEPMCRDGDVRLVGGSSTTEGRLQICYDSVWGAVCSNSFDDNAARVVCKQLGISNIGITRNYYGGSEDVYYVLRLSDSSGCTGDESQLVECSAFPLGDTRGRYSSLCYDTAGVQCVTGLLLVQKLSGGEIFAIIFCCLLFVGSIIVLVLGLAYYKQRQYKKLVRTHSSSDSSSDIHPPTTNETAQGVEQVGVATAVDPSPNQDPAHSLSEPPPPAYCETSDLEQ